MSECDSNAISKALEDADKAIKELKAIRSDLITRYPSIASIAKKKNRNAYFREYMRKYRAALKAQNAQKKEDSE